MAGQDHCHLDVGPDSSESRGVGPPAGVEIDRKGGRCSLVKFMADDPGPKKILPKPRSVGLLRLLLLLPHPSSTFTGEDGPIAGTSVELPPMIQVGPCRRWNFQCLRHRLRAPCLPADDADRFEARREDAPVERVQILSSQPPNRASQQLLPLPVSFKPRASPEPESGAGRSTGPFREPSSRSVGPHPSQT